MADPNKNQKIIAGQKKANAIWEGLVKDFEKIVADATGKAQAAGASTSTKKTEGDKANDARACAEYCRKKIG